MQRSRALMAAALIAAGNAGSPLVRREGASPPPSCDRCGQPMITAHGDWVCGNAMCGVTLEPPKESRQVRRARERAEAKRAKR